MMANIWVGVYIGLEFGCGMVSLYYSNNATMVACGSSHLAEHLYLYVKQLSAQYLILILDCRVFLWLNAKPSCLYNCR